MSQSFLRETRKYSKLFVLCCFALPIFWSGEAAAMKSRYEAGHECVGKGGACITVNPVNLKKEKLTPIDIAYSARAGISITYTKSNYSAAEIKERFSGQSYNQPNDIVLDPEICADMRAPKGCMIKKGSYKITTQRTTFRVEFGNQVATTTPNPTAADTGSKPCPGISIVMASTASRAKTGVFDAGAKTRP